MRAAAGRPGIGPVGLALRAVCKFVAVLGGLVFVGLVIMSIVSIVGRKLASAPVPGDVEVLQMCSAFAASAFFAYCHLNGGDVKVDFFTHNLSSRIVTRLDAFGSLLVGLFGALIALAHCRGCAVTARGGRDHGDPRLAPVDRPDADGPGICAAGAAPGST